MSFSLLKNYPFIFVFALLISCSKEGEKDSFTAAPPSLTPLEINTTDVINDPAIFNYDVNKDYSEQIVEFYILNDKESCLETNRFHEVS